MLKSFVRSVLVISVLSLPISGDIVSTVAAKPMAQNRSPNWQALRDFWRRVTTVPRRRGAGRPDGSFEMISPGIWVGDRAATPPTNNSPVEIWYTHPMVIWRRGNSASLPSQVEVWQVDSKKQKTRIWHQAVPSAEFVTLPVGEVLQPGQQYQIRFLRRDAAIKQDIPIMRPIEIQVMSNEQRNQIAQQLAEVEARFSAGGASPTPKTTSPEIAQARIEVFVNNVLQTTIGPDLHSAFPHLLW